MDVRYINPFIMAVKNVFKSMVATDIHIGKLEILKANAEPRTDVSAVIGLSGDVAGCVVLSLPMQTAITTAGKFAGVEVSPDHPDFSDALGKLANNVAEQSKAQLNGLSVSISLPSVIVGREHIVAQSRQQPRLSLPCNSDLGRFYVEVSMVVEKNEKSTAEATPAVASAEA